MSNQLQIILDEKKQEVAERKKSTPLVRLEEQRLSADPPRGFIKAIKAKKRKKEPAVIAEIKKASPSKGLLRANFNPKEIAESYERNGAACLSVLTDEKFFQGATEYLQQARQATHLPVLRKDFIIDSYQVTETRAMGADCLLLIVAGLTSAQLKDLYQQAQTIGLDVLIEVHDQKELDEALALDPELIGINNRNLHTFHTDLATTFELARDIPKDTIIVSESGIQSAEDIRKLTQAGIPAFLIGESCMRASVPGVKLAELIGAP